MPCMVNQIAAGALLLPVGNLGNVVPVLLTLHILVL